MNCRGRAEKRITRARFLCTVLMASTLGSAPAVGAKAKRVEVKPTQPSGEIAVVSMGKMRTYYPLSARRSSMISVRGPGQLRILTRAQFPPNAKENLSYRVIYSVDGAEQRILDVPGVTRAENAKYRDVRLGNPGQTKSLTVRIGRGYHSIELALRDSLPKVSARYLFTPGKEKKTKWVTLSPLAPIEPVDLFAGEETVHYYRFSGERPLKIEIIGPTSLRILTRVENRFNMKGRSNYRVQIKQGGEVLQTFQLSSRRSETTTYKGTSKLVPGKAREIVFRVPKGKQQYEIVPLEKGTLLGQVMFPKKDAKLGL